MGDVIKADIRRLGLDIARLPSNMTKKYPGISACDVLAQLQDTTGYEALEPRSINKHYQHARSLFAWAAAHARRISAER